MADLNAFLDLIGISDATLHAILVATLVFAAALLVASGIGSARRRRDTNARQAEFNRLQRL